MDHEHTNADALAEALAARVSTAVEEAVSERGEASVVVSGGSTPLPLFRALRGRNLPWSKTTVTLVDERWVPPYHDDSSEGMVRRELLREHAEAANFVGWFDAHTAHHDAATVVWERLRAIPRPFDLVILGMGGDGHFASLFPNDDASDGGLVAADPACLATRAPKAPELRVSMNLAAVLQTRALALHITGAGKRTVYEAAVGDDPEGALPIRSVLRQSQVPLETWWAP